MQGCQCATLPTQLLLFASKIARRSEIPAAHCATARRLSSGVTQLEGPGEKNFAFPVCWSYCRPLAHDSAFGLTGIQRQPVYLAALKVWAHVRGEQWRAFEFFGVASALQLQHPKSAHIPTSWALRDPHQCCSYFFGAFAHREPFFWLAAVKQRAHMH